MITPFSVADYEERQAFQRTLHPSDPRHTSMCVIDDDRANATVYWGSAGGYDIDLTALRDQAHLLAWVMHLGAKTWPHITPYRLTLFARMVCQAKGWPQPSV